MAQGNFISGFSDFAYQAGPYYEDNTINGTVDVQLTNPYNESSVSYCDVIIQLISDVGSIVKSVSKRFGALYGEPLTALQTRTLQDQAWSISTDRVRPKSGYYVRIITDGGNYHTISGGTITIQRPLSDLNYIKNQPPPVIVQNDGNNSSWWPIDLFAVVYGTATAFEGQNDVEFTFPVSLDGLLNDVTMRIYPSNYATIVGGTPIANGGFSLNINLTIQTPTITVQAEDGTQRVYNVIDHYTLPSSDLFIYDNAYTDIVPTELERGETLNWRCLMSNTSQADSSANAILAIKLEDAQAEYSVTIAQVTLPAISQYEDHEETGSFVIPNDIPLGEDIEYNVIFILNNSTVYRQLTISNWDEDALGIVYNRYISGGAFIRETFSKSKFFANINKDFYSLNKAEDANQFYRHTDDIQGDVTLYGQYFNPSITFVVNKFNFQKIFSNMILHLNDVGVLKIEYWTEDQYALHSWPEFPLLQDQARPWIDPEFRENMWYFPVHNEEIYDYELTVNGDQTDVSSVLVSGTIPSTMRSSGKLQYISGGTTYELEYTGIDYVNNEFDLAEPYSFTDGETIVVIPGDDANTREMRGSWLKVKITFRSGDEFVLKNALTEFVESKI